MTIIEMRDLGGYFKKVWGIPPGNKVDLMKQAVESEKIKKSEAVYIGDMMEDYKVARRTGVYFVGRQNKESFDSLDVPVFGDMVGITDWVVNH